LFTVVFILIILTLAILYIKQAKKESQGNWVQFYAKGKEAGFSIKEMEQLRKMAMGSHIENPASIFHSQKQLEICIKYLVRTVRMSQDAEEVGLHDLLSRLFDYVKKLEMESIDVKSSITSSRQMDEGHLLKILVPGTGVFKAEVVKNSVSNLIISRPVNSKVTSAMQWLGLTISVYFWRDDDAGYVFDTEVIDEVFSKGISSLKIQHCDSLFRTQRRKSLRVKLRKPAFLYLASSDDLPGRIEKLPGLNCILDDISDTGCAFNVNGKAAEGLRLKVQFALDRVPVCMLGTVRSVEYDGAADVSLVRMEADPLPMDMRNHVMSEVFQMLPDDDDDELPFREVEEAADIAITNFGNNTPNENDEHIAELQEVINE